jgi:tetratricopeptide (TPR) repeat protein
VLLILSSPAMRDTNIAKSKDIMALFAGLIFVSHPIQTQGVTYIIQRTTSLAALFYILSVCLYAKSRLSHKSAKSLYYYVSSLAFAILAMFTKEFTATLPIAIILYEMSFLKDDKKIRWKYLSPFFVLLFLIPVTMLLAKPVLYIKEKTLGIPLSNYLFTQFRVIVTYIRLLILPINQNVDYDYRISKSPFEAPVLFSLLFLAAIFSAALVLHRRHRLMSFAILWFFLTLSIESSFIPLKDVIFEHRLYLPMAGFSIFLASSIYYIFENKGMKPVITILSVVVIVYSILAYNRNLIWKDPITLWSDTVRKSPNKARPYNNLGFAYQNKGDFDRAILEYGKALKVNPDQFKSYNNRGYLYYLKGNFNQAIVDFNK